MCRRQLSEPKVKKMVKNQHSASDWQRFSWSISFFRKKIVVMHEAVTFSNSIMSVYDIISAASVKLWSLLKCRLTLVLSLSVVSCFMSMFELECVVVFLLLQCFTICMCFPLQSPELFWQPLTPALQVTMHLQVGCSGLRVDFHFASVC